MITSDRNDLFPAQQEKLDWVTPRLTLMWAEDTEGSGKGILNNTEIGTVNQQGRPPEGPS